MRERGRWPANNRTEGILVDDYVTAATKMLAAMKELAEQLALLLEDIQAWTQE
jgi:hypothetical protein